MLINIFYELYAKYPNQDFLQQLDLKNLKV